jgi:DNA-binding HxlR family transcriptional regulator
VRSSKDRAGSPRDRGTSTEPSGRGSAKRPAVLDLLDLLGRRWALRILWEISAGPLRFTEIQERCDAMSPSVLNQRLAELVAAGVVHSNAERRYALPGEGAQLAAGIRPLEAWARRWTRRPGRGRS